MKFENLPRIDRNGKCRQYSCVVAWNSVTGIPLLLAMLSVCRIWFEIRCRFLQGSKQGELEVGFDKAYVFKALHDLLVLPGQSIIRLPRDLRFRDNILKVMLCSWSLKHV